MSVGFLLDTNVISEFLRPDQSPDSDVEQWLESVDPKEIFTSVVVCGEIQRGIEKLGAGKRRHRLEKWLAEDVHEWFESRILSVDFAIALEWGQITHTAQIKGVQLSVPDGLIAATAKHHNLTVATRNDRHINFSNAGVEIFNPWQARNSKAM